MLLLTSTTAAPTTTTAPPPTTTTQPPTTSTTAAPAPPPPPPAPPAPTGACGGYETLMAAHFPADQIATACRIFGCETGYTYSWTIHNQTSTASGGFQFLDGTWESTTGLPPPAADYSPDTQTAAAAKLWRSSGWSPWSCY
jgi:hypothetical protein